MEVMNQQNYEKTTDNVIDFKAMAKQKKDKREIELREKIIERIIESAEKLEW